MVHVELVIVDPMDAGNDDNRVVVRVRICLVHPKVKTLLRRCEGLPEQRTPEWHTQRNERVTASEVAAVLGRSKFQSKNLVLRQKVGAILKNDVLCPPYRGSFITDWGVTHEDRVRDRFCAEYGEVCHETGCVPHLSVPFLGASPDGVLESGCLLEIKCPFMREPVADEVPEMYYHQMQLQMEVCDLDMTYYVEWKPAMDFFEPDRDIFFVQRVYRDPSWLPTWLPVIQGFWERVQAYVSDPERALADLSPRQKKRPRKQTKEIAAFV